MAILRGVPRLKRGKSLRGQIMIDSFRGVLRVRKWPRKRGRPRSAKQRFWVDWFVQANRLAKYADGASQARAIDMTKGSGLYPRDVLLMAMRGRLYTWSTPDGWRWYSMAAIGDISESLDVLAQTVGSVLVRAVDRWRAPTPGSIGDALLYQGPATAPIWGIPAAVGVVTAELAESPVVVDDTESQYDFDVSSYASVEFSFEDIVLASTENIHFRCSTDGGAVFHAGAADYWINYVSAATEISQSLSAIDFNDGATTQPQNSSVSWGNLRFGRGVMRGFAGRTASARMINGLCRFDGPITDIRITQLSGVKFKTGTIRAVGLKA